jgi:cation diffusion facilitator CzcD-associated flavoprotein CzcO
MQPSSNYDAIVVGGGISGIIFLAYAKKAGLKVLLLEKEPELGGLWRKLPAWQDIQTRKEDFSINGLPIHGITQPEILENILSWVNYYQLASFIRCGQAVSQVEWKQDHWQLTTAQETFQARYLVVATGMHNEPFIPTLKREQVTLQEYHSSALLDPESLAGKKITVLGGGPSAFDLLELGLREKAEEIRWVYRSLRWFSPSSKPKDHKPILRNLAFQLMMTDSIDLMSQHTQKLLDAKYQFFGLEAIKPDKPFNWRHDQLVPGRPLMCQNLDRIQRHQGEIRLIRDRTIHLNEEAFETDVLLYATGYRLNLKWMGLAQYAELTDKKTLMPRCGGLLLSHDYPNLFFCGQTLLDTNSSAGFYMATIAKSLVAHIQGKIQLSKTPITENVNHWDLIKLLAQHDTKNYPPWWRLKYKTLAWFYRKFPDRQLRI